MRSHHLSKRARGFTLLELVTTCCIIGILAAITMANYNGSKDKAQKAALLENMHTTQVSTEAYGVDNGGTFPAMASALDPYFPGGNGTGGSPGTRPQNPFTNVVNDKLYAENIADSNGIIALRNSPPSASPGGIGQCGYSQCDTNGVSYCITGADKTGLRVGGMNNTTIVLSNQ